MPPNNNRPQNNAEPSGPPPNQLPRPRMQMSDIRPARVASSPPQRSAATPADPQDVVQQPAPVRPLDAASSQPQPTQRQAHPGDHLLESPHEPLLGAGTAQIQSNATRPDERLSPAEPKKKRSKLKIVMWTFLIFVVTALAAVAAGVWWYQQQLLPVAPNTKNHVRLTIASGSSPSMIAKQLKSENLIKSELAFSIYTKLSNTEGILKAGLYNLAPSETTQEIVDHLVSGKQDTFSVTFLPGDTLANNRKKLIEVGYGEAEVDAALAKTYSRPLFASKPASADLEGYLYGETYEFDSAASVEAILNRTFDEYEKIITRHDLVNGFKKQGLTLYEGITLASIIQREVTGEEDEKQVAGVFVNRLKDGISLGSDVTYQYAARKMGVAPTPQLESPYNTRKYAGLPPGPIAVPGVGALKAVANPGVHDYIFFLSGDDDVTYFAKTDAEHQKNIINHCKQKCLIN